MVIVKLPLQAVPAKLTENTRTSGEQLADDGGPLKVPAPSEPLTSQPAPPHCTVIESRLVPQLVATLEQVHESVLFLVNEYVPLRQPQVPPCPCTVAVTLERLLPQQGPLVEVEDCDEDD